MDIDDPSQVAFHIPPFSLLPSARDMNPFSLLDPKFTRSIFDSGPGFRSGDPFVSHPREVRQIPIEVKDGPSTESDHSGHAPRIEDVTETAAENVPETRGHVIIDEDDDDDFPTSNPAAWNEREDVHDTHLRASAPGIGDLPDYGIEEEMIRAVIEASKHDSAIGQLDDVDDVVPQPRQSQLEDPELAQAVSLSLKTAEQEKALRQLGSEVGPSEPRASKLIEVEEVETLASSNGRNQAKLQRNLMYLAAIADSQPQAPAAHSQYPLGGMMQSGGHYMQQHQQVQQMSPQVLMDARSSMLYSQQQYSSL